MKVTILGCGASQGTPELGCECFTCTSDNLKNKRTRPSIYIESPEAKILVDATPDLRFQALANKITTIDALIITHAHADHISGLDDLKPMTKRATSPIRSYMNQNSWSWIKGTYGYLFEERGSKVYRPILEKHIIEDEQKIQIKDLTIQLFPQNHGEIVSLGLRVGNFAYSTDFTGIPESSLKYLQNLDYWIADCLKFYWSPTHSTYEKTLDLVDRIKPKKTILTHMSHDIEYDSVTKILPENVTAAYDGMTIKF